MAQMDKLIARFKSRPKDFTWDEFKRLLKGLGFQEIQGNGSRVKFFHQEKNCIIQLHRPHPTPILKMYAIKEVLEQLLHEKLI
ncbi:MAG: type II toxin-antitoxin system HicA family toxin [Proteobacteria bacterium]|nr:type II toxin-antitoxin system HicA family toxin [Pseudomonadota bacterium]